MLIIYIVKSHARRLNIRTKNKVYLSKIFRYPSSEDWETRFGFWQTNIRSLRLRLVRWRTYGFLSLFCFRRDKL